MNTPKEKAIIIFNKYYLVLTDFIGNSSIDSRKNYSKQCALIAVGELKEQCWDYRDVDLEKSFDYWNEVELEIKKLC